VVWIWCIIVLWKDDGMLVAVAMPSIVLVVCSLCIFLVYDLYLVRWVLNLCCLVLLRVLRV